MKLIFGKFVGFNELLVSSDKVINKIRKNSYSYKLLRLK